MCGFPTPSRSSFLALSSVFSVFLSVLFITFSLELQECVLLFLLVIVGGQSPPHPSVSCSTLTPLSTLPSRLASCAADKHHCFLFLLSLLPIRVSEGHFDIFNNMFTLQSREEANSKNKP
jgi:hypothetical protein